MFGSLILESQILAPGNSKDKDNPRV